MQVDIEAYMLYNHNAVKISANTNERRKADSKESAEPRMKKIIAFTLALVMLFVFAACSKKSDSVAGAWKTEIEMAKVMGAMNEDAAESYIGELMKDLKVGINLNLKDDGTFELTIDSNKLKEDFKKVMKEKLPALMAEQMGMTEDALKEALAAQNKSIDDLVEEAVSDGDIIDAKDAKGTYKYENGKLYLKGEDSKDKGFKNYAECTLEGNKLTVTGVHSEENVGDLDLEEISKVFPLVFTR